MARVTTAALIPQNKFSTSLSAPFSASDTVAYLANLPTATEGFLTIDEGLSTEEVIFYDSKGSNFVTCPSVADGRGVYGTAQAHAQGATVKMKVVAEYFKALQDGSSMVAGSITPAKLSNPYKFSAYRNAGWTAGVGTQIQFDTELFDTNNNFDTTTNIGRYTAPVSGYYFVASAFTASMSATNGAYIQVRLNGSTIVLQGSQWVTGAATANNQPGVSGLVQLAAGDYLEVLAGGTGGAGGTGRAYVYFHGFLVSSS